MISMSQTVSAQQQVMFTQYMFNGLAINPAYAGSHESLSLTALIREQWVGLDGAPSTQTFAAHTPLKNERVALGFMFLHDKIGITNQNGAYLSYAYRIPMKNGKLSFGLQAGFNNYKATYSSLEFDDDFAFSSNDVNKTLPNFGAGLYYYSDKFYAGFSVPQILKNELDEDNSDTDSKLIQHYFLTAGIVFDLSNALKLKPNVLMKVVEGAPVEWDINANLLIKEVLWLGLSWRSFDSFDALIQFQLTDQLQVGYAYDFATTTDLRRVNSGSHEIMLNYRFNFSKSKLITPRLF